MRIKKIPDLIYKGVVDANDDFIINDSVSLTTKRVKALDIKNYIGGGGGVPPSRLISAGTGLTGGGDLSADRTLSVVDNTTNQKVNVLNNGTSIGVRKSINFIPSGASSLSIADNNTSDRVDVIISSPTAAISNNLAWFNANPTLVLPANQTARITGTSIYKVGDGVAQLQNLKWIKSQLLNDFSNSPNLIGILNSASYNDGTYLNGQFTPTLNTPTPFTPFANYLHLTPIYIPYAINVNALGVYISSAPAGNMKLNLYTNDGYGNGSAVFPTDLVISTGTPGLKYASVSPNLVVNAGLYSLAFCASSTPTIYSAGAIILPYAQKSDGNFYNRMYKSQTYATTFPSTVTTSGFTLDGGYNNTAILCYMQYKLAI